MPLGQDFCQGGASFLGAVLVIIGNEDDVLAIADAAIAFVNEEFRLG